HQPVDAGRDPTMRRDAVLESVEEVAELRADLLAAHAENLENALLQLAVVDADASARNLDAVQHAVISASADVIRPRPQQVHVLRPRRRERMMPVGEVALVVLLEQVHRVDPEELPLTLARKLAPARDLAAQHAARIECAAEHHGRCPAQRVAHIRYHEVVAKIRLVGAVLQQRLLHIDAREWSLDLDAEHLLPHARPQALDERNYVLLSAERHLDIELRDLDDAIRAKVLVAQAPCDLVVAADARHHQKLLQLLRGLRQREELARMQSRRKDEVARDLWRAHELHGRPDLGDI